MDKEFAGLVVGEARDVYVGLPDDEQTVIVKLVEHP